MTNNEWDDFWSDKNVRSSWSKKRIIKILDKYIKPDTLVLDAGCGSGFFTKFFIDKGCRTFALDYSKKALEMTRKTTENRAEKYLAYNLLDKDFSKKIGIEFDIIFSDGLLEHFSQDDQNIIIRNLNKIKKKYGVAINFVPNNVSFWRVLRPFLRLDVQENPFSIAALRNLHENNGMEIVESGGINVLPLGLSPEFLGSRIGMLVYVVVR